MGTTFDKPISVLLNRGPNVRFRAELSVAQLETIRNEFAISGHAAAFLEYRAYLRGERGKEPAGRFIEPFSATLFAILRKHTPYEVALFWPVLDALVGST